MLLQLYDKVAAAQIKRTEKKFLILLVLFIYL